MSRNISEDVFIDMQLSDDEMKSILEETTGNRHDESSQTSRGKKPQKT